MPITKTPAEQKARLLREKEENERKIAELEQKQEQLEHQMTRAKNKLSYDEYHFDLDDIEHDPYVLISYLTAWFGGRSWTLAEAMPVLGTLFDQQYILTETVTTETRYRTETETRMRDVIDPYTGQVVVDPYTGEALQEEYEEEVEVPYDYYICNVSLALLGTVFTFPKAKSQTTMRIFTLKRSLPA